MSLATQLCNVVYSKIKISIANSKPPEQPAPAPEPPPAAAAVENDYLSIKTRIKTTIASKLDSESEDDPFYESIGRSPSAVKSDTSPPESPEPIKHLTDPDLYESSAL